MNYILNYQTWKRLFEQAKPETSTYGKYNFGGTFEANYIMPSKDKKDLAGKTYNDYLKQMVDDLNKEISENGKKLTEIKITIRSSASSTPATNGYSLQTPPNHTFGGLLPKAGWVKKTSSTVNPPGYVAIPNGNEFLAKNRGIEMKKVLVADLAAAGVPVPDANIQLLPREDGKWVSDSANVAEQYVKVEIVGALEKKPIPPPTPKYPYALAINTYTINDNADYVRLREGAMFGSSSIYDKEATASVKDDLKMSVEQAEAKAKTDFSKYVEKMVNDGSKYELSLLLKTNGRRTINQGFDHAFEGFIKIENYDFKENGVYYFNDYTEWLKQSQKGFFGEGGIGSTSLEKLAGTTSITGKNTIVDDQPNRSKDIREENIKKYKVPYTRGIINWKATSTGAEGVGTSGVDAKGTTYTIKEVKGGAVTDLNSLGDKSKSAVPSLKK